jgi:hypothetical protein
LLETGGALWAGSIGSDETANGGKIARFIFRDGGSDFRNTADDFVAGNDGVNGGHEIFPFVADGMEIGVAHAAKEDFDLHIARHRFAAWDFGRSEFGFGAVGGIGFCVGHKILS